MLSSIIEHVEVEVRTRITYTLAIKYDSDGYMYARNFDVEKSGGKAS